MRIKVKNKGEKFCCVDELGLRWMLLNHIHGSLMSAEQVLHLMAHGKAFVQYADTDDSTLIVIKDERLGEQKKEVYKELDDTEQHYINFHSYVEELIEDIEAHMRFVNLKTESVMEGSAIKEFVAEGRSSL
tara:strand:+ start:2702 stop:3094 length:393 start_codon:yes stop_codon:yes gene_type:complete